MSTGFTDILYFLQMHIVSVLADSQYVDTEG